METVDLRLKRFIDRAIEVYNRYRSPESTAKLVRIEGDRVIIKFEGSFCATCGINDWVEDMKYLMEDLGAEAELLEIIEPDEIWPEAEEWRIGVFRVRVKEEASASGRPSHISYGP